MNSAKRRLAAGGLVLCMGLRQARFIIAGSDVAYLAAAARKDVETLRGLA